MHTEVLFRREYVFVGTTEGGYRVLLLGELRREDGRNHQTIQHETVADPVTLSLTSAVFKGKKNISRNHITSGATLEHLGRIVRPAPGYTLDDTRELHRIGTHWHLNTMRAACAHMDVPGGKTTDELLDAKITCPETGYSWGSAWLTEELPQEVADRFVALLRQGRTEEADY